MDNLSGASIPFPLNGREYRLSPLTLADLDELDLWMRSRILDMARKSLPPTATEEQVQATMRAAIDYANTLSVLSEKGAPLLATPEGLARYVHQGLKKNHPELTLDEVLRGLLTPGAIDRAMDRVSMANDFGEPPGKKASRRRRTANRRRRKRASTAG